MGILGHGNAPTVGRSMWRRTVGPPNDSTCVPERTLRFATFLAPEMLDVYERMAAYVGEALETCTAVFVGGHSYDVFAAGEAEFGFI